MGSMSRRNSAKQPLPLTALPACHALKDALDLALTAQLALPRRAAMVNLCRDEVTVTLKQRIEHVFGSSFSTNGLGGVLTCGVTGIGAGLSHSPLCDSGKERYVFFSFPHISINASGEVGPMSRPGRPGQSCACGALIKSWNEIRSEGLTCNCKIPGGTWPEGQGLGSWGRSLA